jgi:hypothetical protein
MPQLNLIIYDDLEVPEQFGSAVMCMMRGQAYLAGAVIGQEIGKHEQVKVLCISSATRNVG